MTISQVKVGNTTHDITLPGLTASVTELNYIDGVTSNIQTQLNAKAASTTVSSHTGNTTVHITSTERTNWNAAKTHADSSHAPSNAEKNQNAFSNVKVGSTTIAADTATDTLELVAGTNITLTPDATNDKVTINVPTASGTQAGATIVYPAASCTTFSSDSGTVTPLAVQKGAKQFAITRPSSSTTNAIARYSNTTGDVQDSKIIIENVTNTADTSKKAQIIAIPAEGGKKMVYGYCTDQVDGTSFIGGVFDASATSYPYASGLAIGGTSGNLLWKGQRVLDNSDLTTINTSISGKAPTSHASTATTYGVGSTSNYGHLKVGSNITVSSGSISLTSSNVTNALGYTPLSTAGGSVTGDITSTGNITATGFIGNASTAGAFATNANVTLTGDVTGTYSSDHSWTVPTTIADNAVKTAKINNAAVTTAKIADSNVTTAKIANSAVNASKIADKSVTVDKLASEIGVVVVQSSEPSSDSAAKIWIKI